MLKSAVSLSFCQPLSTNYANIFTLLYNKTEAYNRSNSLNHLKENDVVWHTVIKPIVDTQ